MIITARNLIVHLVTFTFLVLSAVAQDTYTYDDAGRLVGVDYDNGASVDYLLDDANNRTNEDITNVPTKITATHSGGAEINMRTIANTNGYSGTEDIFFELTVTGNITGSGASGIGNNAISTGTWPSSTYNIKLRLVVDSGVTIRGGGGAGRYGGDWDYEWGGDGYAGGDALDMSEDLELVNNGTLEGGGGGGGGGEAEPGDDCCGEDEEYSTSYGGGGGGGGYPNGKRGYGGDGGSGGSNGANGTTSGGGSGGNGPGPAMNGGAGGNVGAAGSSGGGTKGGDGGVAGYAIDKNGNILLLSGTGTTSNIGS